MLVRMLEQHSSADSDGEMIRLRNKLRNFYWTSCVQLPTGVTQASDLH